MEKDVFLSLIDMAISKEEAACNFYRELANTVQETEARDTLNFIAAEEEQHRLMLVGHRHAGFNADSVSPKAEGYSDLTELIEEPDPDPDIDPKNIYLIAAHREKKAYELYLFLASVQNDEDIRGFLLKMAGEELKHKEKMEYFYSMRSL